ncbi:MAG: hypothetical protein GY851_31935 [bacterium]|nr:hypothetical protein [bacterium]
MRRAALLTLVVLVVAAVAGPAGAWGPTTDVALVTTAAKLISKRTAIPLTNLQRDIQAGASVSESELQALIPTATDNPVTAIESEMILLQAIRGNRVDPYYAYRLGALGKLVSRISSPLADADPEYRRMYYADVDKNVERVPLTARDRQIVDPPVYLPRVQRSAATQRDVILKDYQDGIGFKGVAAQALSGDVSRTINTIADVWYTVIQGSAVVANVPQARLRSYFLDGLQFYIRRGNSTETNAAYTRLAEMGLRTADLQKQVGDMFFDAGQFGRAMEEYNAVLKKEPSRRDVAQRIAEYYVKVGDAALKEGQLESARDAYTRALEADKLHPSAQAKLLEAQKLIDGRDARLEVVRAALTRGRGLESRAEQQSVNRNYGQAMEFLVQARNEYLAVGGEFQREAVEARTGLNRIADGVARLKGELVQNAGSLSGSGATFDARILASEAATDLAKEAFLQVSKKRYMVALDRLQQEYADELEPGAQP